MPTKKLLNITTHEALCKFVLNNMKVLTFGIDGSVDYSKKHDGYLFEGQSHIKGMEYSTSWTHQKDKFTVTLDLNTPQIQQIHETVLNIPNIKESTQMDIYTLRDGKVDITFNERNVYTKRLIHEFSESIVGYSQNDLI